MNLLTVYVFSHFHKSTILLCCCRKTENNSKVFGSLATARSEANFIMPPPSVTRKATQSAKTRKYLLKHCCATVTSVVKSDFFFAV